MPTLHHLVSHVSRFGFKHQLLYMVGGMIFFWALFDGLLTYIIPLLIVEKGFSRSEMGLIIGSSSAVGAVFDLVLSRYLKVPNYQRIYFSMLILSLAFVGFLWQAETLFLFFAAMGVWGLYCNLYTFGNTTFVSQTLKPSEYASSFGVIDVFKSMGVLLAPVLAAVLIGDRVGDRPFVFATLMLVISGFFFFLIIKNRGKNNMPAVKVKPVTWAIEIRLWSKIGRQILPVLVLFFLYYLTHAFFWTLGPLIADELQDLGILKSLFLVAFLLPNLFSGWFVGNVTNRFGKKRTAFFGMLSAAICISGIALVQSSILLIILVFVAATFISFVLPAISGACADYVHETEAYAKEIEGLSDFFYNFAWIIGPISSGFLADWIGNRQSFSLIGIFTVLMTVVLIKITPKKIHIKV